MAGTSGAVRDAIDEISSRAFGWAFRARELVRPTESHPFFGRHGMLHPSLHRAFEAEKRVLRELGVFTEAETFLTLGPGHGHLELDLLGEYPDLQLGYLDSNPRSVELFQAGLAERGYAPRVLERLTSTLQTCRFRERYDVIVAAYFWYSIGTSRLLMKKVLRARRPGGTLVVFLASKDDLLRSTLKQRSTMTAESFSQWARAEGFAHRYVPFEREMPSDFLLEGSEFSDAGRNYAGFLAQIPFDSIPPTARDIALKIIVDADAVDGILRLCRGALVFGPDDG